MPSAKKKAGKGRASKKVSKKKATRKKEPTKANTIPAGWINQTEAAKLCRVSVTMFQRYGIEPAERRGRYTYYALDDVLDFVEQRGYRKGYDTGLREGKDQTPTDLAEILVRKEEAELKWTLERGEGQRLKNEETRRNLAPVEMLTWALGNLAAQVASILEPLPGKIKRRLPKLTNAEIQVIKREIVKLQNVAAESRLDWDEYSAESSRDPGGN